MIAPTESYLYEFDEYRVDPLKRRLLRHGEVVPLTPKAFTILLVLLENRGQVVEKKDLVAQVWGDAYVTEANLTQNVSSLRKALGERAGEARYIVTVPGRGYCFTGHVLVVDRSPTGVFSIAELAARASLDDTRSRLPEPDVRPERRRARRPWLLPALGLGLAAAGLAAYFLLPRQRLAEEAGTRSPVPQRRVVAVLGFRNLAADRSTSWLADALTEMLTSELAAGARLRVVAGENVQQVRQSLASQQDDPLASLDLEQLYSRLGADLVVTGSYLALPDGNTRRIRLDLRVRELPSGDTEASLIETGTEAGLFDLVARSGSDLRQALGVSDLSPSQQREARALQPATAEAARLFTQGLVRLRSSDPLGARDLLQKAVQEDPASAPIHAALAETWSAIGYDAQAMEEARKAVELSGRLAREDALAIQARYEEVSRHWEEASRLYRSLWTFYPDDLEIGLHLAVNLMTAGKGGEALQVLDELRRLPPPAGENARIDLIEARTAYRLSDFVRMQAAAERAAAKATRSGETIILAQALVYQGYRHIQEGQGQEAVAVLRRARELAKTSGHPYTLGMVVGSLGIALQSVGDLDEAAKALEEGLTIARQLGSVVGIGIQYQLLGDLHRIRGDLAKALPLLEKSRASFLEIDDSWRQALVLSLIGSVLSLQGDLDGARQRLGESAAIAEKVGSRLDEANARTALGPVLAAGGDFAGARRELQSAQGLLRALGQKAAPAKVAAARVHLGLARLSLDQGNPQEAARLARQAAVRTGASGERDPRVRALAVLAEALLRQGNQAQARQAADQARELLGTGASRELRLAVAPALARVDAAGGAVEKATADLRQALDEAERTGFVQSALEIRFALGRIQLAHGNPAAGRATLQDLRKEAASRGYRTLDREVAAALR